jgi:hypothetical protein
MALTIIFGVISFIALSPHAIKHSVAPSSGNVYRLMVLAPSVSKVAFEI